jgi:hypothetical protein
MIKIGVIGAYGKARTINILAHLCKEGGFEIRVIESFGHLDIQQYMCELKNNNVDIVIIKMMEEGLIKNIFSPIQFDIIIYTMGRTEEEYEQLYDLEYQLFHKLGLDTFIIMNVDDSRAFKTLKGYK